MSYDLPAGGNAITALQFVDVGLRAGFMERGEIDAVGNHGKWPGEERLSRLWRDGDAVCRVVTKPVAHESFVELALQSGAPFASRMTMCYADWNREFPRLLHNPAAVEVHVAVDGEKRTIKPNNTLELRGILEGISGIAAIVNLS